MIAHTPELLAEIVGRDAAQGVLEPPFNDRLLRTCMVLQHFRGLPLVLREDVELPTSVGGRGAV